MQALFMVFHRLLLASCWSVQVPCKKLTSAMECCFADCHQLAQGKLRPEDKLQPPNIIKFTLLRYVCRLISWFHRPHIENLCHDLICLSCIEPFWIFPELFPFPHKHRRSTGCNICFCAWCQCCWVLRTRATFCVLHYCNFLFCLSPIFSSSLVKEKPWFACQGSLTFQRTSRN